MSNGWWSALYDDLVAELLLVREDPGEVERTARFLERTLHLSPGKRVFDQCCGIGSLSVPLALGGMQVVGVDQCDGYIVRARREAARLGADAEFFVGDAFDFVPMESVDAAFNWWTSFGYTESDAENMKMLARAFDALVPGGMFALDSMNLPGVLRGLQKSVLTRRTTADGEIVLTRETEVDVARGTMNKCWTYFLPNGERVVRTSRLRLYLPHTLGELLARVGFVDVAFFGDIHASALELDSPRCICVARKPE